MRQIQLLQAVACVVAAQWAAAVAPTYSEEMKGAAAVEKSTIVVAGSAEVKIKPDIARINVGVSTSSPTAGQALAENNAAMNALFAVIKAQGVEEKDIRTSNLSIQPQYSQPQGGVRGEFIPRVVGYQVTNSVQLTVRQLNNLGAMLDVLVQNGANQVHGISFDVDKADERLDQVRGEAVKAARRRAELYCSGDKVKPGRVLHIEEQGLESHFPRPVAYDGMRMMAAPAMAAPIAGGESTLNVKVRVVFQLDLKE